MEFNHPRLNKLGFKEHNHVINVYKKTSIAVVCSRWDEPFGRTSLEASANGCAVIITNKGGLPETVTDAKILKKLNVNFVFIPNKDQVYNSKKTKKIKLLKSQKILCAKYRKGHFEGVIDVMDRLTKIIKLC